VAMVKIPAKTSMSIVDALPKTFTVPELFGCSPTNGIVILLESGGLQESLKCWASHEAQLCK